MNGLAHDMYLAEMKRLPDHCKYPVECMMREGGRECAYHGQESQCPLVKDGERRKKAAVARQAHDALMSKYGLRLEEIH